MNIRHGDLSLDTIFVVGNLGQECAKLCRFKGEPAIDLDPNTDDQEQVKMNFDLVGLVNIICALNYPQHPQTGKLLSPSSLIPFTNILSGSPRTPNSTWVQFNIKSWTNHPLFLDDEDMVTFWHAAHRKVERLRTNDWRLYNKLVKAMDKRLQYHEIFDINWVANVVLSDHTHSVACLNYDVGYNMDNSFSFLKFARHSCEHYAALNNHRAVRYLYSYYPGYMCVVHEVLSGRGLFVFRNPY